jgi:hypothetical protein
MIAYHVTAKENLGSIWRLGLLPRNPADNPKWDDVDDETAVYVFHESTNLQFAYGQAKEFAGVFGYDALITVEISGLVTEPDPYQHDRRALDAHLLRAAVRVRERIGPRRLRDYRNLSPCPSGFITPEGETWRGVLTKRCLI